MAKSVMDFRNFVLSKYPKMSASQKEALDSFTKQKMAEQITGGGVPITDVQTDPALMAVQAKQVAEGTYKAKPTDAEEKAQMKVSDVEKSINLLEKNLNQIEVSGPIAGRLSILNLFTGGGAFPEAADYEALRKSLIGPLARAISGEVGQLTDRDIARAEGLLPKITDAQKVRENKLANLKEIIAEKKKQGNTIQQPAQNDPLGLGL